MKYIRNEMKYININNYNDNYNDNNNDNINDNDISERSVKIDHFPPRSTEALVLIFQSKFAG